MPEDRRVLTRAAGSPTSTWAYGSGPDQVVDAYLPTVPGPAPVVVLVHGGFWRPDYTREHLRPMASALAQLGYVSVLVEYARIPGDPDATIRDLRAALAWLPAMTHAVDRPIVVGHSAGGHLSLLAAAWDSGVGGCLALAPVADLERAEELHLGDGAVSDFLGCPARDRPDLDPLRVGERRVPATVVHGERDSIVPVELASTYAHSQDARLVVIPDCGHFELIDPQSRAWPAVMAELSALVRPSGIE